MLQQYSADPTSWKAKDAALYLVTSLASRGQTQKHGITQTSTLVSLPDFCGQHIMPELQKPDGNKIKYIRVLISNWMFLLFWDGLKVKK